MSSSTKEREKSAKENECLLENFEKQVDKEKN
jgi:hypothetical protein